MLSALVRSTRTPLPAAPPAAGAAAPAAPAPAANLNFTIQQQVQTEWCWSAVATSISHFYNASSAWTQCSLANAELGQTTCCQNGSSSACNQPWYLERALQRTGNLQNWTGAPASYAAVQQEIGDSRPLGVRIGWSGGGGHFVVLDGYDTAGDQYLSVKDPFYGASTYSYAAFQTAYQSTGSWTHTYFTKS